MKYLMIISCAILLAACGDKPQPILTKPEAKVFVPDDRYFVCPTIDQFPDPPTLSDGQVAVLLVQLDTNNRTCKTSIQEIRRQLLAAKKSLEAVK